MGWVALSALLAVAFVGFVFIKKEPPAPRPYVLTTNTVETITVTNPCAHLSAVSNGLAIQINISIQDALRMITNYEKPIVTNYVDAVSSSASNWIVSPTLTNNAVYHGQSLMTNSTMLMLTTNSRPASTFYYQIVDVIDWSDTLCVVHVLKAEKRMVDGRAFVCIEPDYYLARFHMVKECNRYKGATGWLLMEVEHVASSWMTITSIKEYP